MEKELLEKLGKELNEKIDEIKKDIEKNVSVEDLETKLSDITTKFEEVVKTEDFQKQQEQLDTIETSIKKLNETQGKKDENLSLMKQIENELNGDKFKEAVKNGIGKEGYKFEVKAATTITESNNITDDSTNNTRVIQEDRDAGIHRAPRPRLTTWDLVRKTTTNSRMIQWVERTSETDGATMIGTDGSAGGKSDGKWASKSQALTAMSAYSKVHRDMLEDWSVVQAEIREILDFDLQALRNNQILTGTGTSNQLRGLIYSSNPWAKIFDAPTSFEGTVDKASYWDVLKIAILQVMQGENTDYRTGYMSTAIVMNPEDVTFMHLTKDADGNYITPEFVTTDGMTVSGIPIVMDSYMTAGTFLVGDFQRADARLRRNIEIKMWEQNENDALNNLVTFTATHRLGFFVKAQHQYAFVYGTFSAAISEIDKVTG